MEDISMQKSVIYLSEVETLAQDILIKKQEKLELSNARNKFNEAVKATEKSDDKKVLVQVGTSYVEFPNDAALKILNENIREATEEIDIIHEEIKRKAAKLRDLEHEEKIEGVSLKPLSAAEAKSINKAFGYT